MPRKVDPDQRMVPEMVLHRRPGLRVSGKSMDQHHRCPGSARRPRQRDPVRFRVDPGPGGGVFGFQCQPYVGGLNAPAMPGARHAADVQPGISRERSCKRRGPDSMFPAVGSGIRPHGFGLRGFLPRNMPADGGRRVTAGWIPDRLPLGKKPSHGLTDGNAGAFIGRMPKDAVARRLNLHCRLVRLNVEQGLAGSDPLSLGDMPSNDPAAGHVHIDLRHDDLDWHQSRPSDRRRAASRMSGTCGTTALSSSGL